MCESPWATPIFGQVFSGQAKKLGRNRLILFFTYPLDLLPAQSDCCRSSFFNFFIFYFSLHSPLDGGIWFQTVGFGSVLECDWKMRFIVPKNHPERKRTSILVEWGRKKLKLIDFLSQSWSAQTTCETPEVHHFSETARFFAERPRLPVVFVICYISASCFFHWFFPLFGRESPPGNSFQWANADDISQRILTLTVSSNFFVLRPR